MAADIAHPGRRSTRMSAVTGWLGSFPAIILSVLVVLMWAMYLPFVKGGFLNTNYQLLINTTTTIVTFIMVFIISPPRTATVEPYRPSWTLSLSPSRATMII